MDRLSWQLVILLSTKLKSNNRKFLANKVRRLSVTIICVLLSGFECLKIQTPRIFCCVWMKQGFFFFFPFLFKNSQTERKKTNKQISFWENLSAKPLLWSQKNAPTVHTRCTEEASRIKQFRNLQQHAVVRPQLISVPPLTSLKKGLGPH